VVDARADAAVAADAPPKKRRLPGVNLRPGSVKQARVEAGLSLAQLGKGHVTAPAIYLVETGRTRPSLPTLEHIARRTGKPVEFFLAEQGGAPDQAQVRLIELEALVAETRPEEAINLGQRLLDEGASAYRLGRIRFFLGQAYTSAGELERAASLLAEARTHFEAVSDGVMLAECIGAQAVLAGASQPKEAIALAEKALAVCRGLKPVPVPTEARLLGILARVHIASHEPEAAIAIYREAIDTAGPVLDLRRLSLTYGGLGAAYRDAGDVETAARYTTRAVALLEVLSDRAVLARSENDLGLLLMSRGDLEAARDHLARALVICAQSDLDEARGPVLLSICELAMNEGRVDDAFDFARQALELAEELEVGASIAESHVWLGRIADRRGEHAAADRELKLAINGFEALGMRERLLQVHGTYAEILERRGDLATAYVHMKEALQASRPGLLRRKPEEERVSSA